MARHEVHLGRRRQRVLIPLATALLIVGAAPAGAVIWGCGFGWGGGPLPGVGETLDLVGVATSIDPRFGADLEANEYTLHITGLTSTGPVDFGQGLYGISFAGGTFEFWRDPNSNASFGMGPPNITVPSTFVDGTAYLYGSFSNFFLFYDANQGFGSYQGVVTFQGGEARPLFEAWYPYEWTLGGSFDAPSANTPPGYWLSTSFVLEAQIENATDESQLSASDVGCLQTVRVDAATWTSVKRIFRE